MNGRSFATEQGSPISTAAPTSESGVASRETPQKITAYTLAPDRYQKARELSRIYFRFRIIGFIYGLVVLWLILRWKLAPKYCIGLTFVSGDFSATVLV